MRARLSGHSGRALVGTLVGSAPGFVLPFAIAAHYGAGRLTDAYFLVAAVVLFAGGLAIVVMEANVLPAATARRSLGRSGLRHFLLRTGAQAAGGTAVIYVAVAVVAAWAIGTQDAWTAAQQDLSVQLLVVSGAYVVVLPLTSTLAAGHYACGSFLTPTLTQSLRSVVPLAVLPILAGTFTSTLWLICALAAGEWLRFIVLLVRLPTIETVAEPFVAPAALWAAVVPHAISMVVSGLNPVIDRAFATTLTAGSLTKLDLAERMLAVPTLAITSSVLLVSGSRWAALRTRPAELEADVRRTLRRTFTLATLVTVVLVGSTGLAALVYPGTVAGVEATSLWAVFAVLMVGFPAGMIAFAGPRFMTSTNQTSWLPQLAVANLLLNTGLTWVGVSVAGLVGIVAATALGRILAGVAYLLVMRALLRRSATVP